MKSFNVRRVFHLSRQKGRAIGTAQHVELLNVHAEFNDIGKGGRTESAKTSGGMEEALVIRKFIGRIKRLRTDRTLDIVILSDVGRQLLLIRHDPEANGTLEVSAINVGAQGLPI